MKTEIQNHLFELQDLKFRDFHARLIPTVDKERVIGVRTPFLRQYAKELYKEGKAEGFLDSLPHTYFDENQLHAFLLGYKKDYEEILEALHRFLPYIDNWATCDQLVPNIKKKDLKRFEQEIEQWLCAKEPYIIRFGIGMLMRFYLDDTFSTAYLERVSQIRSEEYYVNMMIAWYYATALAKQYEATIPYLTEGRLDVWVHNKTIQKARESRRISPEIKEYVKTLKR